MAPLKQGDTGDYFGLVQLGQQAAIYRRVSTADQSYERRAIDLCVFAIRGGYKGVNVFKESGSGTNLDRAERKKIMALPQVSEIDSICKRDVLWRLSSRVPVVRSTTTS